MCAFILWQRHIPLVNGEKEDMKRIPYTLWHCSSCSLSMLPPPSSDKTERCESFGDHQQHQGNTSNAKEEENMFWSQNQSKYFRQERHSKTDAHKFPRSSSPYISHPLPSCAVWKYFKTKCFPILNYQTNNLRGFRFNNTHNTKASRYRNPIKLTWNFSKSTQARPSLWLCHPYSMHTPPTSYECVY